MPQSEFIHFLFISYPLSSKRNVSEELSNVLAATERGGGGRVSTRDACGLLSGHTLIALASDLARLRLLCCGVACCDGSSVEISITQANDK